MPVIPNLTATTEQIIGLTATAMLASGASLIWAGRKPDEQSNLRRDAIWNAIKTWVELPITRFHDKQDVLPLAEKPPKLPMEIGKCLSRNHSSLWSTLQKLRREYRECKNTDSSAKSTKVVEGRTITTCLYTGIRRTKEKGIDATMFSVTGTDQIRNSRQASHSVEVLVEYNPNEMRRRTGHGRMFGYDIEASREANYEIRRIDNDYLSEE